MAAAVVKEKFVVRLHYYGSTYFLQTFLFPNSSTRGFQAVLERNEASEFSRSDAMRFARAFNGKMVPA